MNFLLRLEKEDSDIEITQEPLPKAEERGGFYLRSFLAKDPLEFYVRNRVKFRREYFTSSIYEGFFTLDPGVWAGTTITIPSTPPPRRPETVTNHVSEMARQLNELERREAQRIAERERIEAERNRPRRPWEPRGNRFNP